VKQKPSIALSLFILIFFVFSAESFAQNSTASFPRLSPDPKATEYFYISGGGQNTWTKLAEISLWASGDLSNSNIEKISAISQAIKNSPDLPKNFLEKAEFILNYMHKNILKTYSLHQTRIDTMLSTGRYNCVSSAVLYMILCESLDILTFGVITKDHAFIKIPAGDTEVDVETTTAYGFDPGNRKEFHDQFGKVTGFAYVPAKNYRDRETVGSMQLISLIMNNRIAELERQRRWDEAVVLAIDRAALLFGDSLAVMEGEELLFTHIFKDPRIELLDRFSNYGTILLRANKEEDCIRWVQIVSSLYPDRERWQELAMAAVNNRVNRFLREKKINEAAAFLEGNKFHLAAADFSKLNDLIKNNRAIDYHNRFAAAWNKKNFEEAERILNEGLSEFPNNSQLLSDKQITDKYKQYQ